MMHTDEPWALPLPLSMLPVTEHSSWKSMPPGWTGIPLCGGNPVHPGSFGAVRKHHVHEGMDLYCEKGTPVHAVEKGVVTGVVKFTGEHANSPSPWWNNTWALMIEGRSGTVLYGEIAEPNFILSAQIRKGQKIAHVIPVLKHDKGLPVCMLHLELYEKGITAPVEGRKNHPLPSCLLDPSAHLLRASVSALRSASFPEFLVAENHIIPISEIMRANISDVEKGSVQLFVRGYENSASYTVTARGFDAIEAVMLLKAGVIEGRRGMLRWERGAWAFHNVVAHPVMQLLAWIGYRKAAVRFHDSTVPVPRLSESR